MDVSIRASDSAIPLWLLLHSPPSSHWPGLSRPDRDNRERSCGGKSLEEEGMAEGLPGRFGEAQGIRVRCPN